MNILLIEDMAGFAVPIQQALEARGHTVTWFIGATSIDETTVVGILAKPDAKPMESEDPFDGDPSRLRSARLADFELALVDGGLVGPVKNGVDFVAKLTLAKVPSISISGGGAGNPPLIKAGAFAGLPKEHVLLAVTQGLLDLKSPVKASRRLASRLSRFSKEIRAQAESARQRSERFDYGYPFLKELV